MSEIEKLMQNAGVKKLLYCDTCKAQEYALGLCAETKCEPFYPPFTAEKQLEIIKWLAYKTHITIGKGLPWGQYDDNWWTVTSKKGYSGMNAYNFEEALAQILNNLWQDLTEEEKAEIKRILE